MGPSGQFSDSSYLLYSLAPSHPLLLPPTTAFHASQVSSPLSLDHGCASIPSSPQLSFFSWPEMPCNSFFTYLNLIHLSGFKASSPFSRKPLLAVQSTQNPPFSNCQQHSQSQHTFEQNISTCYHFCTDASPSQMDYWLTLTNKSPSEASTAQNMGIQRICSENK